MLSAIENKATLWGGFVFFIMKGIRTRREKGKGFRKKTVRWTVFADGGNERSEAREATASEKSLALRHKNTGLISGLSQKSPIAFAIGLFAL